ncbi:MAG: acyl-CoA/acyl-ACP dehydrogenase [Arenicella sp.]|nr:acyl-CoA/acyl-ACP dehydrogenase [Arenicella sp.]
MSSELQQIMVESTERIFSDTVDKKLLDAVESGEFPQQLWKLICENGFHLLATTDSGADLADAFAVLRVAGRYAVPIPLAEVLLGNRWLDGSDDNLISIGERSGDRTLTVPWAQQAARCLAVTPDNRVFEISDYQSTSGRNIAFEPRDTLSGNFTEIKTDDDAYELMALSRLSLASGALNRVLELTIQYVGEREQFGRPIAKFQAVQHNLAVAAAEVAAATRACDGAVEAIGEERFVLEVAAGKGRVGEAITVVTEIVHQLHGAMGFTHEHQLHHFTRRLWSWREEFGGESYWQSRLGHHLHSLGADSVWDFIASAK